MNPNARGVCLGALLLASAAVAGDPKQAYFGGTPEGSWARYDNESEGAGQKFSGTDTWTRLPDEGGGLAFQIETEVRGAAAFTSTNRYVLTPGFDFATHGLSYGKAVAKLALGVGEDAPVAQPDAMVKVIRDGFPDYRGALTFVREDTVGGRPCDRYRYEVAMHAGPTQQRERGDVCLSASVPFGIVQKRGQTTDSKGASVSSYQLILSQHGLEPEATAAAAAPVAAEGTASPAPRGPARWDAAYRDEWIRFQVEVVPGSEGARLRMTPINKGDGTVRIVVPKEAVELEAGSPVGTMRLVPETALGELELEGGGEGPAFDVVQKGWRGATAGRFEISIYEGTPLYSGSVTIDTLPSGRP